MQNAVSAATVKTFWEDYVEQTTADWKKENSTWPTALRTLH